MRPRLERARSLAIDVSPLQESVGYRALWIGQIISLAGTHMRTVAVAFQVFALTGSTVAVGLIGAAEVVPLIAFSMIGGALADTVDKRRILAVTQVMLMLDSLALAIVTLSGSPSLPWIYALVAVGSALTAVDQPARHAITPSLVRPEQIPAAMALRQVVYQTTHIAGPALSGVLIAALRSVGWLYVIDALTYLAALIALRWVPSVQTAVANDEAAGRRLSPGAIRQGLSYALHTPVLLAIFLVDLGAMIFGMPRAVFPALAEEVFAVGAAGLGLLYAAPSAGALVGALTSGWVERVSRRGVAVLLAVAAWGAAIVLAGLSLFSFPLTLFFLALAGAADVVSAVFRSTLLLEVTPAHLLGRVNALNLMVVSGGPKLGDVEAGLVARAVGAGPSVVVGGAACLGLTAIIAAVFRSLRAYRAPDRQSEKAESLQPAGLAVSQLNGRSSKADP